MNKATYLQSLANEMAYLNSGYDDKTVYVTLLEQLRGVSDHLPVLEEFMEYLDRAEIVQATNYAFEEIIEAEGLN